MISTSRLTLSPRRRVPEPLVTAADDELRAHVERVLAAHYELDCEIGRGGMGVVYRARDKRLKRQVAIKLLPPELTFRSDIKSRFLREAETAAQLSHPNIVPIYAVDELESLVFFVMAYVSGDNLAKRLHERGVLTVDETRRVMREVADALAYAHDRGVVHRDIKPDNILLDAVSGRAMVTDFGIARAMDSSGDSRLTATGMAIGTPAYMSPEQASGDRELDGRSDLYSLGILGYQMLSGEPPFAATSTPAMLVKHISERPIPVEQRRADAPMDLARSVMMLLEKDPANRFPTATSLVNALDARETPPSTAPPASPPRVAFASAAPGTTYPADGPYAPAPFVGAHRPVVGATSADIRRWEAAPVVTFRKKLVPYMFVNGVIVLFSIFGRSDLLGLTGLWSVYIAFKYAKLWSESYDWRDVFRQPRDREIMEVVEDASDHVRAVFDPRTRERLREQRHQRKLAARSGVGTPSGFDASPGDTYAAATLQGAHGDRLRQAIVDRDEILRRLESLGG
ncbi:MAG: serine/threonine protein kinase, partial [Gemmatimonadaceae bacterium]|nr:serine/threonine protein kinase [Gemmatimonadaceae bacterium]